MYLARFGLTGNPFSSQPTAAHFVPTPGHDEALARLLFLGETSSAGGILLGGTGLGKTLLLEVFARALRRKGIATASVSAIQTDLLETTFSLAAQWGASLPAGLPANRLARLLTERLTELKYDQVPAVLLIDDLAQASDARLTSLEELISTLGHANAPTIVAASEADALARLPRSLGCRADLTIELPAWNAEDVGQYLNHRLNKAGCTQALFDDAAVLALSDASQGNPRRVSQLAQLSLVAAAAQGLEEIDAETVHQVCQELFASSL
jgi:general secretion pathway protein A